MIRVKPSLEILLEDIESSSYRPDPKREIAPIIPYTSTENLVALRGLGRHISILYKSVRRNSASSDRALLAVHDFFFDDVDIFRQKAQNAISSLNSEAESPSYYAPLIAATRLGHIARKSAQWPRGNDKEAKLIELFHNTLGLEGEVQDNMRHWALRSAINNRRFWLDQLEANRQHPLVLQIAEEIKLSGPDDEDEFAEVA